MKTCLKAVSAFAFGLGLTALPVMAAETQNGLPPIQQGIGERGALTLKGQSPQSGHSPDTEQDRLRADENMRRRDKYISQHGSETMEGEQANEATFSPQTDTHVQARTDLETGRSRNKSVHDAAMKPAARGGANADTHEDNRNDAAGMPPNDPVMPHVTPHAVGR